jgi:hypothetical protein
MCQTFIHPILNIRYMYFNLASTVIFREHRDHRARWSFGFPQYPITNPSLSSTCIMNLSGELSNLSLSTHLRFAALKFSGGLHKSTEKFDSSGIWTRDSCSRENISCSIYSHSSAFWMMIFKANFSPFIWKTITRKIS